MTRSYTPPTVVLAAGVVVAVVVVVLLLVAAVVAVGIIYLRQAEPGHDRGDAHPTFAPQYVPCRVRHPLALLRAALG